MHKRFNIFKPKWIWITRTIARNDCARSDITAWKLIKQLRRAERQLWERTKFRARRASRQIKHGLLEKRESICILIRCLYKFTSLALSRRRLMNWSRDKTPTRQWHATRSCFLPSLSLCNDRRKKKHTHAHGQLVNPFLRNNETKKKPAQRGSGPGGSTRSPARGLCCPDHVPPLV